MLVKTTLKEILKTTLEGNIQITDNSVCGQCSKCGECCSNILPVSQEEVNKIQKYVIKNNVKPQTQMVVMQNRLACPYYDGKKCLIYEVRPLICKEFYCYKKPNIKMAAKFSKEKHVTVDMWSVAKNIENIRKNYRRKK